MRYSLRDGVTRKIKNLLINSSLSVMLAISSLGAALSLIVAYPALAAPTSYTQVPFTASEVQNNWSPDRTSPSGNYAGGNSVDGRSNVLTMGVDSTNANTSGTFYQTEGLLRSIPTSDTVKADLYVDGAWQGKSVRAGLWAVGQDSTGAVSAYPILEFSTARHADGTIGWQAWDGVNGGWSNLNTPYTWNTWNTVEISLNQTTHQFDLYINGTTATANAADTTTGIGAVILNDYNYATGNNSDDYSVSWSNLAYGLYPPAAPTGLQFVNGATTYACGSTVNSVFNNQLQFVWTDPSGNIRSHRTLITYPDGTSKTAYTGSRNVWIGNITKYNYDNGFGEHGNGVYSYNVQAEDAHGLWGDTASCTLSYDTTKPTAQFTNATTYPTPNGAYNGDIPVAYTVQDNVKLKGVNVALFDTDPSHSNHWVANCYSNSNVGSASASGTCTIHIPTSTPDGTYYVQVGGQDAAGYWTVNATRSLTIDRTVPTTPVLQQPANNGYEKTNDFYFTWSPSTDNNGAVTYEFQSDGNGTFVSPWDSIANGNSEQNHLTTPQIHSTGAPDGTYYWRVRAIDAAGNDSAWSTTYKMTIDTTEPVATITGPAANDTVGGNTLTISGTASDSNFTKYRYYVKDSGGKVVGNPGWSKVGNSQVANGTLGTWDITGLPTGTYTIGMDVYDAAGNYTWAGHSFTIDHTAPASTNDLSSLISGTVTVTQTITDDTAPASGKLRIWKLDANGQPDNAQFYASTVQNVDSNGVVTYTFDSLKDLHGDGTYLAKFTSTDTMGNGSVQQAYFTVDNTAPGTPVANPAAGTYTGAQLVTLSSDDSNGSGVAGIYYTTDGTTPSSSNGTLYSGAFEISSSATVNAIAYDNAGNPSAVLTAAYTIKPVLGLQFSAAAPSNTRHDGGNQNNGNGTVLGTSTDESNSDSNGQVKGASTTTPSTADLAATTSAPQKAKAANAFLGLGWWWLAILLVVIGFATWLFRRTNRTEA